MTSIALLGTVPIVPVLLELNHKVGYILGPILGVMFIIAFFGMMSFLAWEKHRDIAHAQDVEKAKPAPKKRSRLMAVLTCAACRGAGSRRGAKAPPSAAATPAMGATPVKPGQAAAAQAGAGAGAGVSPGRDPRNLSPLNLFKGGKGASPAPAQAQGSNNFMTSNPVYGSTTPATPGSAASGARSPVADFFKRSSSQVCSDAMVHLICTPLPTINAHSCGRGLWLMVLTYIILLLLMDMADACCLLFQVSSLATRMSGGGRTPTAQGAGEGGAAVGQAAQMETPRGAATPR